MELNLKIIYHDKETGQVLCFTHAVKAVIAGHIVVPEVDEFGASSYDMRTCYCEEEGCPTWDSMTIH